jgi:hypothetical protein
MSRLRFAIVAVLAVSACRIEDRTPAGSRRDDEAIRAVLAQYYRDVASHDWAASRALFWDSATVGVRGISPDTAWRDFRSADAYHRHLARVYVDGGQPRLSVRIFRLDLRQEGDLASAWVTTRRRPLPGEGRAEVGTSDNVVLRRDGGSWRILALASMPDPVAVR